MLGVNWRMKDPLVLSMSPTSAITNNEYGFLPAKSMLTLVMS